MRISRKLLYFLIPAMLLIIIIWNIFTVPIFIPVATVEAFETVYDNYRGRTTHVTNYIFIEGGGLFGDVRFALVVALYKNSGQYDWDKYADYGLNIIVDVIKIEEKTPLYPVGKGYTLRIKDCEVIDELKESEQVLMIDHGEVLSLIWPYNDTWKLFAPFRVFFINLTQPPRTIHLKFSYSIHAILKPSGHIELGSGNVILTFQPKW